MMTIVLMISIVLTMVNIDGWCWWWWWWWWWRSDPFRTVGIFLSFVVDAVDVQYKFLSLFQMSKLVASRRVSSFVSRTMFVICHCTRALSQFGIRQQIFLDQFGSTHANNQDTQRPVGQRDPVIRKRFEFIIPLPCLLVSVIWKYEMCRYV